MRKRKITIIILFIIIVLIIISIPMIVEAEKDQHWRELQSNSLEIPENNDSTNLNDGGSGVPLFNEEEYRKEQNMKKQKNNNDSNLIPESETTPEEKAMYEKWSKENEESLNKGLLVESLLKKYYEEEYKTLESIRPDRSNGPIELTLTEYDVKRAELIVKLYKEQKLNKEEKEACKHELNIAYKTPYNEIKLSDSLKKEIEEIIK